MINKPPPFALDDSDRNKVLPGFGLTPQERASPLWLKLMVYFEGQLAALRKKNDEISRNDTDTAALRGQIRQLKALIALNNERPDTSQ